MYPVKTLIDKAVEVCSSRYALAKRLDIDEGNLSRMYNGKLGVPPVLAARIAAIADEDPREAALAAIVEKERDPNVRAQLARMFRLGAGPAAAAILSAVALLSPQDSHAKQGLSAFSASQSVHYVNFNMS